MNDINEKGNTMITAFDSNIKSLVRDWHVLKNVLKSWNIRDSVQIAAKMDPLTEELKENWNSLQTETNQVFDEIKLNLNSPEFILSLEKAIKDLNIPLAGEFPNYDIPPFKLSISLENYEARLSLGRKIERTPSLNPQELAKWVSLRYKKISGRKFNLSAFLKDMLEAYSISNRLNFREKDTAWGRAVPLNDIYELLTLKQTARQDYPKQFFMYDLGLLKEQSTISYGEYRFELGFARNQLKSILIVDSLGRQSMISSLTIYKEVES
ncbi:MAG: hypothetical protein Q7J78_01655 [Clostridiales bacterium]|nr:hypothetical protein [Clostridiales bacterium]